MVSAARPAGVSLRQTHIGRAIPPCIVTRSPRGSTRRPAHRWARATIDATRSSNLPPAGSSEWHCRGALVGLVPTMTRLCIGLILLAAGCSDWTDSDFVEGFRAGIVSKRREAQIPPDRSLSMLEYRQLGLPSPGRPWSGPDLKTAQGVLGTLAQERGEQLPRYNSPRSGELFARLVEVHEGRPKPDTQLSLDEQLVAVIPAYQEYLGFAQELIKIYLSAYTKREAGISELIEVTGAAGRSCAVVLGLLDAKLAQTPPDHPSYAKLNSGSAQMVTGIRKMFTGGTSMLAEPHPNEAKKRLIGHLRQMAPMLVSGLSKSEVARLSVELDGVAQRPEQLLVKTEVLQLSALLADSLSGG